MINCTKSINIVEAIADIQPKSLNTDRVFNKIIKIIVITDAKSDNSFVWQILWIPKFHEFQGWVLLFYCFTVGPAEWCNMGLCTTSQLSNFPSGGDPRNDPKENIHKHVAKCKDTVSLTTIKQGQSSFMKLQSHNRQHQTHTHTHTHKQTENIKLHCKHNPNNNDPNTDTQTKQQLCTNIYTHMCILINGHI